MQHTATPDAATPPRASLIESALDGERRAQETVYGQIRSFSRYVAARLPAHAADVDADDLAQIVNQKLYTSVKGKFVSRGKDESYLFSLVRLTALEIVRATTRRKRREESIREPAVASSASEARLDVQAILSRLSDDCRELLERVYLEDVSYAELAESMGIKESSVRSKLTRCIQRARHVAD